MTSWLIAVVTAVLSAAGAFAGVWYSRRTIRAERLETAEELATRFREPLLQAVFNLQTRLYNMVELGFLSRFLSSESTEDEREYAVLNTLYVFAQYFCWVEIVRRDSQFVDPRNIERNRAIAHALEDVRDAFTDSLRDPERAFRIFRGQQRAIGEIMLVPTVGLPGAPRWDCLGYAAFVAAIEDGRTARWFAVLRDDIAQMAGDVEHGQRRLRRIQNSLMDILDVLDPDARRVPSDIRRRLTMP